MNLLARVAGIFHDRGPAPPSLAIDVRAMWPGDVPQVLKIEAASFPLSDRWTAEDFQQAFDPGSPASGHVAVAAAGIVGFCMTRRDERHVGRDASGLL
jgi:hypothetical protein